MVRHHLVLPLRVRITKKKWFVLNLNQYRNTHFFALNKAKKLYKELITEQVSTLPKMEKVILLYKLFPRTRQLTDIDNVISVHAKFFQDALSELGRIPEDNYLHVIGYAAEFGKVDPLNPRVEVTIKQLI